MVGLALGVTVLATGTQQGESVVFSSFFRPTYQFVLRCSVSRPVIFRDSVVFRVVLLMPHSHHTFSAYNTQCDSAALRAWSVCVVAGACRSLYPISMEK